MNSLRKKDDGSLLENQVSRTPDTEGDSMGLATSARIIAVVVRDGTDEKLVPFPNATTERNDIASAIEQLRTDILELKKAFTSSERREWYSPSEAAKILGRKSYTVREWCRLARINARKRQTGRGDSDEWEISEGEIERYRNHGLLPIPRKY